MRTTTGAGRTGGGSAATAVVFVLVAAMVPAAETYRILAVETIAGKSHWNFMSAVLRSLTDAGHEVTAFTPFPDGGRDNYTEVDTSRDFPMKLDMDVQLMVELFGSSLNVIGVMTTFGRAYCDIVLGNGRLRDMTRRAENRSDRFDAIVVEPLVVDCVSSLAVALDVPVIYAIPSPMYNQMEREYTGHFSNPASVSHIFSRHAVLETFGRRLANAALLAYSVLVTSYDKWTLKSADPRPYDSSPSVGPSMVFVNSHYVTEAARPVTADRVDVGGIHLKPPKAIPKTILEFIEDSPHGVIYFSFGSTVNMSTLPDHVENAFIKALARVPQKVLWRRERKMKDMPKNVMIQKWFPQRDLLLHSSVKLFISHGGISGMYESVDAGVPVLGFPLFFDQPRNIGHLVHYGMAISMDLLSVTEDTVFNAIEELIYNETYKKNAMITSERFKDRPISPEKSVVYWTEYVIRHKGAPHLKSYALNLTWYQYLLLDVIAAVLLLVLFSVFVCYKSFKVICKFVLRILTKDKMKVQ